MAWHELEITSDLSDALIWVLGDAPTRAEPVVVVAACLDSLAKGYGLSESGRIADDPLERADLPDPATALLRHLFAGGGPELTADAVRDGLCKVLERLAQDPEARRALNRNQPLTEVELLRSGQIYWNLESRGARSGLPIRPGRITVQGRTVAADIPVPGGTRDFAAITWTARVKEGSGRSSGQGFRTQGARLAVLAARRIISTSPGPLPDMAGPVLNNKPAGRDAGRISAIAWPADEPAVPTSEAGAQHDALAGEPGRLLPGGPGVAEGSRFDAQRVLVGAPAGVGEDYQSRGFDEDLERLWGDGGDRRVWLRGGPGLGKSYSARRVMQQALADQSPDREVLLIWVDSADPATVTRAYAQAMDRLGRRGAAATAGSEAAVEERARALLGLLATSPWRWLVVLDNADAGSLIGAGLVPPGSNPNGRVLLTTLSQDHRIGSHGRAATAGLFTAEEAEAYLRREAHSLGGGGPLALAGQSETRALAEAVGRHPLALSVAAATIVANAMTIPDWIGEFGAATVMDAAADAPDAGGYPHLIGATWQIALARAARGLPDGVVERAATLAALQDPDGHPTWLWDRPAVAGWVAGDGSGLARHHGIPVAVRRLIDHGIVELRGGTWKHGRVAIHQLAARAVRELLARAALADLAGILAGEWLLRLAADPGDAQWDAMQANLAPIAALADLPAPTAQTVTALTHYQRKSPSPGWLEMLEENLADLAPALDAGGSTGRAHLAMSLGEQGDYLAALGRHGQARERYERATGLYREVLEDPSLDDGLRADHLKSLGELESKLDRPDDARARLTQAADLYRRLLQRDPDSEDLADWLVALMGLYENLGTPDLKIALLPLADKLLQRTRVDHSAGPVSRWAVRRRGAQWSRLGTIMRTLGQTDRARQCLDLAVLSHQLAAVVFATDNAMLAGLHKSHRDGALRDLALLHCQTGDWGQAQHCLTRIATDEFKDDGCRLGGDDLVLLASIQQHLGRPDDADANLALAVEKYLADPPTPVPTRAELIRMVDEIPEEEGVDEDVREFLALNPKRLALQHLYARLGMLVDAAEERGRLQDAQGLADALLAAAKETADDAPGDSLVEFLLASAYSKRGGVLRARGVWDAAALDYDRAAAILQLQADIDPASAGEQRLLAAALDGQRACLAAAGRPDDAIVAATRCVAAWRRSMELDPEDRDVAESLAEALNALARLASVEQGDADTAVGCLEESIGILSSLAEQAPDHAEGLTDLADALQLLGLVLDTHDRNEAAVGPLRRAAATYTDVLARLSPDDDETRKELAATQGFLGWALRGTGHPQEALAALNESVTSWRALAERAPDDRESQRGLALALAVLAGAHADDGRQEEAADCLSRSANILQLLADLDPGERPALLIGVLESLAEALRDLGRTEEADQAEARARALEAAFPDEDEDDQ